MVKLYNFLHRQDLTNGRYWNIYIADLSKIYSVAIDIELSADIKLYGTYGGYTVTECDITYYAEINDLRKVIKRIKNRTRKPRKSNEKRIKQTRKIPGDAG